MSSFPDQKHEPSELEVEKENKKHVLSFKVSHILATLLCVWFLIVQLLGLFFFAKGFLLTRLVLDSKSECRVLPNGEASSVVDGCWHPKSFDKAVVIVVDALRYDFTVPSHAAPAGRLQGHFLDNLPFLYDTAFNKPGNAVLLPFIADPPTSTLQRLKGLTTGTLPVFIDVGSSFAGTAIEEDNLVTQLVDAGKTIVHLGDDTWHSLFPGHFDSNLTRAYDSFNVWDLHSVDNGVIEHIMPLLGSGKQNQWDVIFAHFLGVDHAGHRYGPDHPAMAEKLRQMDQVLRDIASGIDDKTLLVVMGDHGMDTKGDHGGESDDEVEAALWMYAKSHRFGRLDPSHVLPPSHAKDRAVGQIDLVSTLSILLGLPIPFNNLGTPIAEAFLGTKAPDWQNLASVERLTFEQIQKYQTLYSESRDLSGNDKQAQLSRDVIQAVKDVKQNGWESVHTQYKSWHEESIGMYRRLWASFTISDMLNGVEILALGLIVLFIFARYMNDNKANVTVGLLRAVGIGTSAGMTTGPLLAVALPDYFSAVSGCLYGLGIGGSISALSYFWQKRSFIGRAVMPSFWGWASLIFCVTQSAGFAANSFTIHEDSILMFFLSTFGLLSAVSSLRQSSTSDRVLGVYQSVVFVGLTRLSSYSRLCREEQMPGCRSTFYASSASSTSAPWQLIIPFVVALVLPELIKAFYRSTASYAGSAGFWIGICFRAGLILVAIQWAFDAADNGNWLKGVITSPTIKTISITLARCILAIAVPAGVGTFVWARPCLDVTVNPGPAESKPQITILGFANAFGTRYFLMLPALVLIIALLLPPMGQFAIAICAWQILCLLEILDSNSLTIDRFSQSSIGPIVLAMLGSYHFFKTGHQVVLSSIQWNAAFVPLRTIRYPWSPLLVLFNTLGGQILCAAAVPLTALWKRPISKAGMRNIWNDVLNACLTHMLYFATIQLATTMWAGHLRRHLMLYRVFMPRFLMASGVLIIVDVVLILVALTGVRITGLSVGEFFGF